MRGPSRRAATICAALAVLAACNKPPVPEPTPRPVRVLTVTVGEVTDQRTFSGEVRARHESKLASRVGGKVLARHVDVGDRVRRGTLLAEIDTVDFQHARASLAAQVVAARAERTFARDELQRYRELHARQFISQAELDRRDTAFQSAAERVRTLEAELATAANQVDYARLRSDQEGVVTAVAVEAGQVVSPGQTLFTVARLEEREVVISMPERDLAGLEKGQTARVTLSARPRQPLRGRVREISPAAEPGSRTYAVRLSLPEAPGWVALGMTADATFESRREVQAAVPLAALFEPQASAGAGPRVWVLDEGTHTVRSTPVHVNRVLDGERVQLEGLEAGRQIVVAGAHRLREGQKVRVLGDEAPVRARARSAE
jgi:membrane fusion protein, multidrug efflux system